MGHFYFLLLAFVLPDFEKTTRGQQTKSQAANTASRKPTRKLCVFLLWPGIYKLAMLSFTDSSEGFSKIGMLTFGRWLKQLFEFFLFSFLAKRETLIHPKSRPLQSQSHDVCLSERLEMGWGSVSDFTNQLVEVALGFFPLRIFAKLWAKTWAFILSSLQRSRRTIRVITPFWQSPKLIIFPLIFECFLLFNEVLCNCFALAAKFMRWAYLSSLSSRFFACSDPFERGGMKWNRNTYPKLQLYLQHDSRFKVSLGKYQKSSVERSEWIIIVCFFLVEPEKKETQHFLWSCGCAAVLWKKNRALIRMFFGGLWVRCQKPRWFKSAVVTWLDPQVRWVLSRKAAIDGVGHVSRFHHPHKGRSILPGRRVLHW